MYDTVETTIYAIKKDTYRMHTIKPFGNRQDIHAVVQDEYVKFFNEMPEKVVVMSTLECWQFWILPNRIIIQIGNKIVRDVDTFRKAVRKNFTAFRNRKLVDGIYV
jgi:hypothetical protein